MSVCGHVSAAVHPAHDTLTPHSCYALCTSRSVIEVIRLIYSNTGSEDRKTSLCSPPLVTPHPPGQTPLPAGPPHAAKKSGPLATETRALQRPKALAPEEKFVDLAGRLCGWCA